MVILFSKILYKYADIPNPIADINVKMIIDKIPKRIPNIIGRTGL